MGTSNSGHGSVALCGQGGVAATDPATYVFSTLLISTVEMGSAALAARRATTIDPVQALRAE